jgi:hypothetical protein
MTREQISVGRGLAMVASAIAKAIAGWIVVIAVIAIPLTIAGSIAIAAGVMLN